MALLTDIDFGTTEGMHPMMGECPSAFKASKTKDPDTPNYSEAVYGEYSTEFQQAMIDEITALERHKTWSVIKNSQIPEGANVLPGTWAFRIKRLPDGTLRKHKARFCARGDKQIEGVDYFDKYAPVVQWSTVRMMLCIAASEGLKTRQVDFSNAFVQATLTEEVFKTLPQGFLADTDEPDVVLKLHKPLYGLVQAPMHWGNHLKGALERGVFKASVNDPC